MYVIPYMATGTKLHEAVISGIRHAVNYMFTFWDVKQLRLIVTDVSEQPIAPFQGSSSPTTNTCCVTFQNREVLFLSSHPEKYTLAVADETNSNFTLFKSSVFCFKCDCFEGSTSNPHRLPRKQVGEVPVRIGRANPTAVIGRWRGRHPIGAQRQNVK